MAANGLAVRRLARKLLALSDLDGHFLYECYKECIPLHEASAAEALPLLRPNGFFAAALGGSAEAVAYRSAFARQSLHAPQPHAGHAGIPLDISRTGANGAATPPTMPATEEGASIQPHALHVTPTGCHDLKVQDELVTRETTEAKPGATHQGVADAAVPSVWVEARPLRASCELMYRSLLGMYAMQSTRLKFER